MPKRKEPELDPKEQFKRFQETAREHGVDENADHLESAFKQAAQSKQRRKVGQKREDVPD